MVQKIDKNANDSFEVQTFPVPGGPNSNMPFQGDNRPVKYLGLKHQLEHTNQVFSKQRRKYYCRMIETVTLVKMNIASGN